MLAVLIVEDDDLIASGLRYALEGEGYAVTHAGDLATAKTVLAETNVDLILLDLSLPDGTGFDLVEALKTHSAAGEGGSLPSLSAAADSEGSDPPSPAVIFLTAADDEGNTVHAFDMGADDYIVKPFRVRELLARVAAVLRRRGSTQAPAEQAGGVEVLTLGRDGLVRIDTATATVSLHGQEVELTALEYRLLLLFAMHKGRVLTRRQILDSLYASAGEYVNDNPLTVYVRRLRQKLGDDLVETVRGLGYKA
jgi:DNA-binding response OmpR family regulator